MISALLVDDEPLALKSLRLLLAEHCPEVYAVREAGDIETAYQIINDHNPHLIFLDINMPHGSGLELLERIKGLEVEVIFTTAYQEYAIQALRLSALDFLLKPIDPEELKAAVAKFQKKNTPAKDYSLVSEILNGKKLNRMAIHTTTGILILHLAEILYLTADRNYTVFHLKAREVISSKPLGEYERLLEKWNFFRVHRSNLVNLSHILEYKKGKSPKVLLKDGSELEVSRNRRDALVAKLSMIS